MTTKELLKKATEIAGEYFDTIHYVDFNFNVNHEEGTESMELSAVVTFNEQSDVISTDINSLVENYSAEALLTQFEIAIKTEHKNHFPNSEEKTTDLEIEVEQIKKQVKYSTQPRDFKSVDETQNIKS